MTPLILHRDGGFALILAICTAAILGIIAASLIAADAGSLAGVRAVTRRTELEGIADAGVMLAIANLTDADVRHHWPVDGSVRRVDFAGETIEVSILDEGGEFDINSASCSSIGFLLTAAGLGTEAAAEEADKICDWREPGEAKHLNGAKAEEYRAAGMSYGPRGAPFRSPEELALVMGMKPDLMSRLQPVITAGAQGGAGSTDMFARLAANGAGGAVTSADQNTAAPNSPAFGSGGIDYSGRSFAIHATIERPGGERFTRAAVIRLTGDRRQPYWILRWR